MPNIPIEAILYIFIAIIIVLVIWIVRIELKLKTLLRGKNGVSLEGTFKEIQEDLKKMGVFKEDIEKYLTSVEKRLKRSIQGAETISFKAFGGLDSGGAQSFATALLNENGDGVIISTLHARDRVNVFSKRVHGFKPELELSEEEMAALTKAKESCKL
jgi:hypothetical protein